MNRSLQNYLLTFLLATSVQVNTLGAPHNSQEAIRWLYKAITSYDKEDYGAAKTSLNMALETEPNFAEAYLVKGLLEYHDGQTDKANISWKKALDLNPRLPDEMRKRLENRAHNIESKLTQQDFSHFHLQFNGAEQREQAWQAVKSLDDAYNEMGSLFGVFPEDKITVIIFTSNEFWEAWNAPSWLGGFFDGRDGRIRVRMDTPPGGDEEYRRRLRHEFTHAFIHKLYSKDLPIWFQEGVAQYYAFANPTDSFWKQKRLDTIQKTTKGAPWMDLDKVESAVKKKNVHPGLIYLGYLESEALVLYVARDHGDSWIPRVVERLRAGASFNDAYKEVVGITPEVSMEQLVHSMS